MLFTVLAVAAGIAAVWLDAPGAADLVSAVVAAAGALADRAVAMTVELVAPNTAEQNVGIARVVAAALAPALATVLLAAGVRLAAFGRRLLAAGLVGIALVGLVSDPSGASVLLLVVAIVTAVLLVTATGALLMAPLAAACAAVAATAVKDVFTPQTTGPAAELAQLTGASVELTTLTLATAVAVAAVLSLAAIVARR